MEDNTERFITSVCTFMACAFSCFTHVTHTHRRAGLVLVLSTECLRGASQDQTAGSSSSLLERSQTSGPGTLLWAAPDLSRSPAGKPGAGSARTEQPRALRRSCCPWALRSWAWPAGCGRQIAEASTELVPAARRGEGQKVLAEDPEPRTPRWSLRTRGRRKPCAAAYVFL